MDEIPAELRAEVLRWRNFPRERPAHIDPAGPGQESVWDYPRPPRVEPVPAPVQVTFNGRLIAASRRALRVLETASPPVYYLPPDDVELDFLVPARQTTLCEWKGISRYWHVEVDGRRARHAAWSYPESWSGFAAIAGCFAFNAGRLGPCTVDGEQVTPQPGAYYGGWITGNLTGPFKGAPGSERW